MNNPLGLTYCEPIYDALIAQPWNTASNVVFFIVAILLWGQYKRIEAAEGSFHLKALTLSPILIGLCSSIWHGTMIGWTLWLDITSIVIFVLLYVTYIGVVLMKRGWGLSIFALMAIGILSALSTHYLGHLLPQRSAGFLPIVVILGLITWSQWRIQSSDTLSFALATLFFVLALVMRVVDEAMCGVMPFGTHFLWHVGAGITAYLVMCPVLRPSGVSS